MRFFMLYRCEAEKILIVEMPTLGTYILELQVDAAFQGFLQGASLEGPNVQRKFKMTLMKET